MLHSEGTVYDFQRKGKAAMLLVVATKYSTIYLLYLAVPYNG